MGNQGKLLEGKWALVTGASKGIGKAIALAFADEGANLWLAARSKDKLQETAQECKALGAKEIVILGADLSDKKAIEEVAQHVESKIDILVNNSGLVDNSSPLEGDPDYWEKVIELDLITPMRLTRYVTAAMAKREGGGHIINISSVAGIEPNPKQAAYSAAKYGFTGWSKASFDELKAHNIRVTAIYPGYVASDMTADVQLPHEDMIRPEDIAQAALLPFRMSPNGCPTDIVVKPAKKLS